MKLTVLSNGKPVKNPWTYAIGVLVLLVAWNWVIFIFISKPVVDKYVKEPAQQAKMLELAAIEDCKSNGGQWYEAYRSQGVCIPSVIK